MRALIAAGKVDPSSLASLARGIGDIVKRTGAIGPGPGAVELTAAVITEVAKGRDGLLGTEDDLIPASVVGAIKLLTDQGAMSDVAELALGAAAAAAKRATGGCCGGSKTV